GRVEHPWVAAHDNVGADVLERLEDRPAVAPPVVYQADAGGRTHAVSVPFVDGTPVSVGSIATAVRSARAVALNAASIMWWALDPASTETCSVSLALLANARKNSSASSWSKPPVPPGGRSAANAQYGRPEMSSV